MKIKKITFIVFCIFWLEFLFRTYDVLSGNILSPDLFMVFNRNAWQNTVHPILLYTNRRSYDGLLPFIEPGGSFTVETNAHGFRTHEFFPKQPSEYRIMVLGDSFTYGYNANQDKTYPAVLERLLKQNIASNITVYSLAAAGYSTIQYALLTRIYLDYLKPNLVIVALDLSNFTRDKENIQDFILDGQGIPIAPKHIPQEMSNEHFAIGQYGKLTAFSDARAYRLEKLLLGSSLFHHGYRLYIQAYTYWFSIKTSLYRSEANRGKLPTSTYEQLTRIGGSDISNALPQRLLDNIIPYDLPTARQAYTVTYRLLSFIRDETKTRHIPLYFSSYPYPWMVSVTEAIPYQMSVFGRIYDFRTDTVPTQLMDEYSHDLGVPHINAYPTFRANPDGMYGAYDPHFNENGYAQYAKVLFDGIRDEVQRTDTN